MNDQPEQFKKAPRRKAPQGRSVTMSAEAKKAYLDIILERDKLRSYEQHLSPNEPKR